MHPGIFQAARLALPLFFILGIVAAWNPQGQFWNGVEPPKAQVEAYSSSKLESAKILDSSIYQQSKLDRLFREPQNTLSNLAFVATGLAIGFASRRILSRSLAVACIFLGIGSGLYHASLLPEWRMLDILGVYVALFSLVGVGAAAVFPRIQRQGPMIAMAIWLVGFAAGIFRNDVRVAGFKVLDSTYVVVACIAAGTMLALLCVRGVSDRRRYWRGVALLALASGAAFLGGITDRFGGLWANPAAWVQGHAVWHVMGAAGLLACYELFAMTGYDQSVFASPNLRRHGTRAEERSHWI